MPRIKLPDISLHYEERGSGPVLLLAHGYPLDHQMWRHQLEGLSARYRVIAPDLRGFGQSDVTPGVVTMQRFADDLDALLTALQIQEPVTFCGLSMGGYVAWQFVERHRARLDKLILCDTKAAADSPDAAKKRIESAQLVLAEGPQAIADGLLEKLFAPGTAEAQPDMVRATRKVILGTRPDAIAAALRGMAERPDITPSLGQIDVPTLLICGEHDAITPVAEMEKVAAAIPGAKFAVIKSAGHMAPLEQPADVNAVIEEFLGA